MFIVTMVFLIALIFSVQQLLFQYSAIDLSDSPKVRDSYMIQNIRDALQSGLDSSDDCFEARANIEELKDLTSQGLQSGYSIVMIGELDCSSSGAWPSPPELTLLITLTAGDARETRTEFGLSRSP
jgi:hypothetical protein